LDEGLFDLFDVIQVLVEQNQIIAAAGVQRAQLFVRNFGSLSVRSVLSEG
jgi:hypothetical protein